MKTLAITLCVIVVVLLSAIFIGSTELRNLVRLKQSEINGLKKANKIERDSLHRVIKLKNDTILIAKNTILLQADTIKIDKAIKEKYKRDVHDKIHFIQFANDAKRDSVLSKLYITYRHP